MNWRYETVEGLVERNDEEGFVLRFPPLPDGAVLCEVQAEFEDFNTHQPSGFTATIQVPYPDGRIRCGSGCPVCHTSTQPGGADAEAVDATARGSGIAEPERGPAPVATGSRAG